MSQEQIIRPDFGSVSSRVSFSEDEEERLRQASSAGQYRGDFDVPSFLCGCGEATLYLKPIHAQSPPEMSLTKRWILGGFEYCYERSGIGSHATEDFDEMMQLVEAEIAAYGEERISSYEAIAKQRAREGAVRRRRASFRVVPSN